MNTESLLIKEQQQQRFTILRVYNYYRILLSSVLLFLFRDENFSTFVGNVYPQLFQITILVYLAVNILIGLATLMIRIELLSKTAPLFIILIGDIIALSLLMSASGGVSSGLGNFLIFTVAFGGGLIAGRISTVLPAIAFILSIYNEFYLFFKSANELQSFFQAGLLGIALFVVNILFQTLSRELRRKETEVLTLANINQLVVDQMKTGVVVVTSDNEIRLINKAAEDLLTTPNLNQARLPYSLIDRLDSWHKIKDGNTKRFHTHESGPEMLTTFSPLTSDANSDILVYLEDSTEVQHQAQQLKLASLGRLSASIAHEIRNPLGAISHAAQLLRESQNLDKGDSRLSEIIQDQSIRMNKVIENVLQMSRRGSAEPQYIRLDGWLDQFVQDFTASGPSDASIEVFVHDQVDGVDVDPDHLSQVLNNLCQNGLRYSDKHIGESKIVLNAGIETVSGRVYLDVIDYGEGISDDLVQNLFEPFYTTESTGTGLGLYLSRELCEANHARLSYRKADTGGSCFRISFLQ